MKKVGLVDVLFLAIAACSNEPKLNKVEETAVENQLTKDQKAMDSLENALKAQMNALDADSSDADSL